MSLDVATLTPGEQQALVDRFFWYHTLELRPGVASKGAVDHRPTFARYGFPSVAGRSVLDIAAGDGYFSFAFERLGARRVVATDIDRFTFDQLDAPPRTRARRLRKFRPLAGQEEQWEERQRAAADLGLPAPTAFWLAHRFLQSNVEFKTLSIYDVAELREQFDLVFVGTVIDGLQDLTAAFDAVRAVTREQAVVACADLLDFRVHRGWRWAAYQLVRSVTAAAGLQDDFPMVRERPVALYTANDGGSIWRPSVKCVHEMLLSAGFRDVQVYSRFSLTHQRHGTPMNHVVFHAFV
jgi:SAM-dependent methyltransferase